MRISTLATLLFIPFVAPSLLPAQTGVEDSSSSGAFATRPLLESRADALEREASAAGASRGERSEKEFEASLLRLRLREGDFQPGDQIVLVVEGEAALTDTFTVRAGRVLSLPTIEDVSVDGVLRAEIEPHLAAHIARFVRDPSVHATPLVRVAVLGSVGRPGFYAMPADLLVSDAIMRAGGPVADTDLDRTEIRRESQRVWSPSEVQMAIAAGYTLDQLNMRAGDKIVVGERRTTNWQTIFQSVGVVSGIVGLLITLNR